MGSLLAQPTLVLNKSWIAIATTTVRSVITMVFSGSAMIVNPDTYQVYSFNEWKDFSVENLDNKKVLQGVDFKLVVPEVVLLKKYNKIPKTHLPFTRKNLYARDNYMCQYCGATPGAKELTIDHVFPRSRGGETSWENCVLSCVGCNMKKGDRTPRELGWRFKTKPVQPKWSPAFKVKEIKVLSSWQKFIDAAYWNIELEE